MNIVTEEKSQANRIFISYKRADLALVSKIKERIESELHETCWFDLDGIESRQQFRSKICKAIDRATIFLFMYSKSHLNIDFENDWTIKELDYAQTKKKIVVLVNIDNTPLDNLFLLDFGSKNNIDANDATQMKKLITDLKGWLGIKEDQIAEDVSNDIRIIRYSEENLSNQRSELSKRIESIDSQYLRKKLMSDLEQSNPSAFEERSKSRSLLKQIDALNSEIDSLKQEAEKTIKEKLASGEYVTRVAVEQIKRTANAEAEENIRIALDAQAKKYQTTIEELKKKSTTLESQLAELRKSVEKNNLLTFTVKGVSFKMVKVAGGTFNMGATAEQGKDAYDSERPVHQVTLSNYYIGQTEVTQALWTAVMGRNPSEFKGDNLPVEQVSWYDCQTFIEKLNSLLSNELDGKRFALPTEAQWEFAARGGNESHGYKYAGSNNIDDVAWFEYNSGKQTHPVAQKRPNELGLYDMSGNVWEWCQDWYDKYSSYAQTNPQGPTSGTNRVHRGVSWYSDAEYCRVSIRSSGAPDFRYYFLGLRLCLLPYYIADAESVG